MRRAVLVAWLFGWLGATPLAAQEVAAPEPDPARCPCPRPEADVAAPDCPASPGGESAVAAPVPWQPVWGVAGLRAIPDGLKVAPNGQEYHPNFSLDLDFNFWVWRGQRVYAFADMHLWGERAEYGVTNANDGFLGTSKREFDLSGGVAWNYAGPWEARAWGYTDNNLNRGTNPVTPSGFTDGACLENRYYLSPEYARLGQPEFDVARADFVSVGYYPTKEMVGNDGQVFKPGLVLRAYLTCDLWDLPCYAFGDVTFLTERSMQPRLLLFDVGLAARPFRRCPQCEVRLGAENTADFQARDIFSQWYVAFRYLF